MGNVEGAERVITVSQEEFQKGPRRLRTDEIENRRALAPVFDITPRTERLATVSHLPTALTEPVEPIDDVVELMLNTNDIPTTIALQLALQGFDTQAKQLLEYRKSLTDAKFEEKDIDIFAIEFAGNLDEELKQKGLTAAGIQLALQSVVQIETYIPKRRRG